MTSHDWIPDREQDLVDLMQRWLTALASPVYRTQFNWNADDCTAVSTAINNFLSARSAYAADNSTVKRMAKDEAKKTAVAAMRDFAKTSVKYNKKMPPETKLIMGVREDDKTPTARPVPTIKPGAEAIPSGKGRHTVTAINPQTESKHKPDLVKSVAFAYRVRAAAEAAFPAADMPSVYQAEASRDFQWPQETYGQVADYACAYENERGERGPWSDVVSVIIA